MTAPERLYGRPGAEHLYGDPAELFEAEIEPYGEPVEWVIEEWTVHPPLYHFPSPVTVAEWVNEWIGENGEVTEGWDWPHKDAPAIIGGALDRIAALITYRMADNKVGEHRLVWDDDADPTFDGSPLYGVER